LGSGRPRLELTLPVRFPSSREEIPVAREAERAMIAL
jgi:hypothetical protein